MPPKHAIRDPQTFDALLDALDATKSVAEASRQVGASSVTVWRVVATPEFQAALQSRVRARLAIDAIDALEYLGKVVRDPSQATTNRVAAAKLLAERAGYVAPKAAEQAKNATSPAEMTNEQLLRHVEEIERELSQRAQPVTPSSTQLIDILE